MILNCLEVHISDICNLNCRGCSHFANIETEPNYPSFDEFDKDLRRMKSLFDEIKMIRVMGGEPLKNEHFIEYLHIARNIFNETDICLVSNGLLVQYISSDDMRAIAELNVRFSISLYPPTVEIKDELIDLFELYGVKYFFTEPITKFRRRVDMTASNDEKVNFSECLFKDYSFLYHGRFAVCSSPILIEKYNSYFLKDIDVSEDVIDIYAPYVDKKYMESYFEAPKKCCKYCGKPEEFDWSNQGEPQYNDWLIDN